MEVDGNENGAAIAEELESKKFAIVQCYLNADIALLGEDTSSKGSLLVAAMAEMSKDKSNSSVVLKSNFRVTLEQHMLKLQIPS